MHAADGSPQDHCAKKLLPWLDGMLDADEAYFRQHGEPLYSSHMIDLSEEDVEWNIATTAKYLKRAKPMGQWLEMEIGITGGEEDGVNNGRCAPPTPRAPTKHVGTHADPPRRRSTESVDNNSLYTQPDDILNIYNRLSQDQPVLLHRRRLRQRPRRVQAGQRKLQPAARGGGGGGGASYPMLTAATTRSNCTPSS